MAEIAVEAGVTMVRVLGFTPELMQTGTAYMHTGQISGGDVMLTVGACYKARFGLMVDARYNLGMSTVAGNVDSKVSSAVVSIAYLFDIVK